MSKPLRLPTLSMAKESRARNNFRPGAQGPLSAVSWQLRDAVPDDIHFGLDCSPGPIASHLILDPKAQLPSPR